MKQVPMSKERMLLLLGLIYSEESHRYRIGRVLIERDEKFTYQELAKETGAPLTSVRDAVPRLQENYAISEEPVITEKGGKSKKVGICGVSRRGKPQSKLECLKILDLNFSSPSTRVSVGEVLILSDEPLSTSEITMKADVKPSAVWSSIEALQKHFDFETVKQGGKVKYRIVSPLGQSVSGTLALLNSVFCLAHQEVA